MNVKLQAMSVIKDISENLSQPARKDVAAVDNSPAWVNQVAVLTGALAALAGFLTVSSTMLTNEAIYESNQAILSQTEASDNWAEYQANSIKARMAEVQIIAATGITAGNRKQLQSIAGEMRDREPKLKENATRKIEERNAHLNNAKERLDRKDILGYAGMATQLGIALASVAALIRRRSIFYAGAGAGAVGVILTAYVFAGGYFMHH